MTHFTIYKRIINVLFLTAMIVPATGATAFASEYLDMINYYKARAEAMNANVGQATAQSSMVAAQAGHIRAQGEYLKSRADAFVTIQNGRKIQQEIHSMKLDNKLKHADVFYKKRKLHDDYRTAHPTRYTSPGKEKPVERRIVATRLTSQQLNYDGEISWPYALMDERFTENREKLEAFFAVQSRGVDLGGCHDVRTVANDMKQTLKSMIRSIPPGEYMAATKMLDGLTTEVRFLPQKRGNRVATQQTPKLDNPG